MFTAVCACVCVCVGRRTALHPTYSTTPWTEVRIIMGQHLERHDCGPTEALFLRDVLKVRVCVRVCGSECAFTTELGAHCLCTSNSSRLWTTHRTFQQKPILVNVAWRVAYSGPSVPGVGPAGRPPPLQGRASGEKPGSE